MVLEYIFTEGTASPYDIMYDKVHPAPEDPVIIDTSESLSAASPPSQSMVRMSDDTIYVVYKRKLGAKYQIYVKYSLNEGDTWSDRVLLSDVAGMDGYSQIGQCIAVDSEDNLHVVWGGRAAGYAFDQIWYRKYDGAWGPPIPVDPHVASIDQSEPSIAVDSEDILHLVWGQFHTDNYINKIYYTKYNGSWATPILISTAAGMEMTYSQYTSVLAVDSVDNLHVVWLGKATGFTTNNQVWYATAVSPYAAPNWVTPIRISTETNMEDYVQARSCIAIDYEDKPHVFWHGKAAVTSNKIWYATAVSPYAAPNWVTPISISTAAGMENYDQYSPTITINSTNDLHVLWEGKATGYTDQNKIWYATAVSPYAAPNWVTPEAIQPTGKNSYSNIRWSRWPYEPAFVDSNTDLFGKFVICRTGMPLNLPAIFWVRHPYWLWTDRRYLNGVIELDEKLIGNAILEYVIEGVMQDLKCHLIDNNLDYEWDSIVDTPKLIRRATTYGVVAALYARKAQTFTSRVIPVVAPVTVTVIGDDERAMNHWVDKMNNALELYISAQGGLVMDSSTADEEPVFTMADIPTTITEFTSWHEWLLVRGGR